MPPDDQHEFDDADLPGLEDESPPSEHEGAGDGWDDADLPGLEDVVPSVEPQTPAGTTRPDWSDAELDAWFENRFGGERRLEDASETARLEGWDLKDFPDLAFGLQAYRSVVSDESAGYFATLDTKDRWSLLSREAKTRFRRGWENWTARGTLTDSVVGELADYDAMETLVDARHRLGELPQWIVIVGGFGIIGVVLATLFVLSSGSDDSETAGAGPTSDTDATATVAPTTAAVVEPTVAPTTARASEPTIALAIDDPLNWVTMVDTELLADPDGDVWVVATPATPWIAGPPPDDAAWSLIVDVGLDLGARVHSVRWTLHDGSTRGESHIEGDIEAALEAEIWLTPAGQIAVKLPGISPTGGLAANDVGPDAMIDLFGQWWPEEDSEIQRVENSVAVGSIAQTAEPLPLPGWEPIQTDLGPITLIIPDISDA